MQTDTDISHPIHLIVDAEYKFSYRTISVFVSIIDAGSGEDECVDREEIKA